ncbi:MAG: hypothetical protein ABI903_10070 [Actinomycetota bacterium]
MGLFSRVREAVDARAPSPRPVPDVPIPEEGDSPQSLRRTMDDVIEFINRSAGRLPGVAVVHARRITDALRETIDTSQVRPLDVYAVLAVKSTLNDYLPTTLRSYLAVDTALINTPRGSGRTPSQSLLEQLDDLQRSASATLVAARDQDADALMTQGSFLRTKFSGSDLDL